VHRTPRCCPVRRYGACGQRRAGTLDGVSATATGEKRPFPTRKPGLIRGLLDRFGHLVHELGKFGVVGGVAFVVDLVMFNVALASRVEPLAAKTFSTVVAATVAFIGNRFWTWRHRERSGLAREYGLYFFFNAVGLAIGLACLAVSHYGLGSIWPGLFQSKIADNVAANLVGTALGTLFRFWSYRRFVFISPTQRDAPATVTEGD
jgi:putative flippase GtrA